MVICEVVTLGELSGGRMRFALDPADTEIDAGSRVLDKSNRSTCMENRIWGTLPPDTFPREAIEITD
jgi:hypothetical protein